MKLLFAFVVASVVAASAAQSGTKRNEKAPAPQTGAKVVAKPAPKPLEVPKEAVQTEPGVFRYTDPQGKKWIYRKTPFAVVRMEDTGAASVPAPAPRSSAATAEAESAGIKAVEDGDVIRFERSTPWGVTKWQRNKAELDEKEQAAWDRARAASGKQD
jgi:hypothetical protein